MKNNKFKRIKTFVYGLTAILFVTGLYLAIQQSYSWIGTSLIIASLFSCYRGIRYIGNLERDGLEEDPHLTRHRKETAQVIYVSIVDDAGNLLPDAEAKAKIRRAEAQAGPRATVISVKRKV